MNAPDRRLALLLCVALAGLAPSVQAQQPEVTLEQFLESLDFQTGEVELPGGIAQLDMPEGFLYLWPADAERVLVEAWGNPPGSGADGLGMLLSGETGLFGEQSWAVMISYEEDGHVPDDDASEIDYAELLETMREGTREGNAARREAGYPGVELVGWAAPPRYDALEHKLYWAKTLQFEGSPGETLNYNVRVLGRKGVLVLNVIADMAALGTVEANVPAVLAMTEFTMGYRYADFDPNLDEVAAYGIGALIAGKLAAKAGLLAKLGVLLLVLKKFWIVIAIAVVALARRLFRRPRPDATT